MHISVLRSYSLLPKNKASISDRAVSCSVDRFDCTRDLKNNLKLWGMSPVPVTVWPSITSFVHSVLWLEVLKCRGWFSSNMQFLSWFVDCSCLAQTVAMNWWTFYLVHFFSSASEQWVIWQMTSISPFLPCNFADFAESFELLMLTIDVEWVTHLC